MSATITTTVSTPSGLPITLSRLENREDFGHWRQVVSGYLRCKGLGDYLHSESYGDHETDAEVVLFLYNHCKHSALDHRRLNSHTTAKALWEVIHIFFGDERQFFELCQENDKAISTADFSSPGYDEWD